MGDENRSWVRDVRSRDGDLRILRHVLHILHRVHVLHIHHRGLRILCRVHVHRIHHHGLHSYRRNPFRRRPSEIQTQLSIAFKIVLMMKVIGRIAVTIMTINLRRLQ